MKTPPTILELCEQATKGPYITDHDIVYVVRNGPGTTRTIIANCSYPQFHIGDTRANAQLIARLSPEVVKAVYEALDAGFQQAMIAEEYAVVLTAAGRFPAAAVTSELNATRRTKTQIKNALSALDSLP